MPVALACVVSPDSGMAGDSFMVTAAATNLRMKRPAVYSYTTTGGVVSGVDASAKVDTSGLAAGAYVVTGTVSQGERVEEHATCTASFTILAPPPPTISCSASPVEVVSGGTSTITAQGMSSTNRTLTYSYTTSAGTVTGTSTRAMLSAAGVDPGTINVTCAVVDDLGKTASAIASVAVTMPPVVVAPATRELCAVSFERDRKRPVRVDNEAKGCLDEVALQMQRDTDGRLVIVGDSSVDDKPGAAAERAVNEKKYLVDDKGIDAKRIEVRTGAVDGRSATNVFVPLGATYGEGTTVVVDGR